MGSAREEPITIASGQTTSNAFKTVDEQLLGLDLPTMTGTTATFQRKNTAGTWQAVRDVGGASVYSITIGTAGYVAVDPRVFVGARELRLVSGSSEGSDRSGYASLGPVL